MMVPPIQQRNNAFGKGTPGHRLRCEFVLCLLQIACLPLGDLRPGQYNFLALRLQIFGPPTTVHSALWKTEQGRRASVFVVDFIVDFTDLMMTSSQLPPTQRHTQNLCWCIFYHLPEIQYCTRLTEQRKVAGFPFSHVPTVIFQSILVFKFAICNTLTSE